MDVNKKMIEYYSLFAKPDNMEPNTPSEIAMLNLFRDRFYSSEDALVRRYISMSEFKNEVMFLNHIISKVCHDLDINLDCIVESNVTGEYFKPKRMPRYINIEKHFLIYKSVYQEIRKTFDEVKRDIIKSNKQAEEKRKLDYEFVWFE